VGILSFTGHKKTASKSGWRLKTNIMLKSVSLGKPAQEAFIK
jgi:hypothetical protein